MILTKFCSLLQFLSLLHCFGRGMIIPSVHSRNHIRSDSSLHCFSCDRRHERNLFSHTVAAPSTLGFISTASSRRGSLRLYSRKKSVILSSDDANTKNTNKFADDNLAGLEEKIQSTIESISTCEDKIAAVEMEIADVGKQLTSLMRNANVIDLKAEKLADFLREKERQLREEELKLLEKELKLREEERQLREEKCLLLVQMNLTGKLPPNEVFESESSIRAARNILHSCISAETLDIAVSDSSFPPPSPSSCARDKLIDIDRVVNESAAIVQKMVALSGDESFFRIPPLMLSRLARGGKTTTLWLLFEHLKTIGMCPIYITYNGNFAPVHGEQPTVALCRLIAEELSTAKSPLATASLSDHTIDWAVIEQHLSSEQRPIVLLIDELNGMPLDDTARKFLRQHFLDPLNRYLVFSTHQPMNVDTLHTLIGNKRGTKVVEMSQSTDVMKFRALGPLFATTSWSEVAYYHGIPALLFCTKLGISTPRKRFSAAKLRPKKSVAFELVDKLLFGRICYIDSKMMNDLQMFSIVREYGTLEWPLCNVHCILETAAENDPLLVELRDTISLLASHAVSPGSGVMWELIVHIALILHGIKFVRDPDYIYPLNVIPESDAVAIEHGKERYFSVQNLPDEVQTTDQFKDWLKQLLKSSDHSANLFPRLILCRPTFERFPGVDHFIVYAPTDSIESVCITACQEKSTLSQYPKNPPPDGMRGLLLKAVLPGKQVDKLKSNWTQLNDQELCGLLGVTLSSLRAPPSSPPVR